MSGLIDHVLTYDARGWSIIPTRDKIPALRSWKPYQTECATPETLRCSFGKSGVNGLAVVCGAVSGDLVVRDFDDMDAYERWAREHPGLAATLPTVRTPRGRHVYFQDSHDGIVSIDRNGVHEGELRGAGYVLLPPSRLSTGLGYEWTIPLPDGPLTALDAVEAGLLPVNERAFDYSNAPTKQRENAPTKQREEKRTERIEAIGCGGGSLEIDEHLRKIVESTLPTSEGQRNGAIFELARALKAEKAYADGDPLELEPIVRLWHAMALPAISTKPFEDVWFDFLYGWNRVKWPRGAFRMDAIFEKAISTEPPEVAKRYDSPKCRQLVSLCRELQRNTGDQPFFLSCRTAGKLLHVDHIKVWRWLSGLKLDGVLQEVSRGDGKKKGGGYRATRFFYVAGDDGATDVATNAGTDST